MKPNMMGLNHKGFGAAVVFRAGVESGFWSSEVVFAIVPAYRHPPACSNRR